MSTHVHWTAALVNSNCGLTDMGPIVKFPDVLMHTHACVLHAVMEADF